MTILPSLLSPLQIKVNVLFFLSLSIYCRLAMEREKDSLECQKTAALERSVLWRTATESFTTLNSATTPKTLDFSVVSR